MVRHLQLHINSRDSIDGMFRALCADAAPVEMELGEGVFSAQLSAAHGGKVCGVRHGPRNLGWKRNGTRLSQIEKKYKYISL